MDSKTVIRRLSLLAVAITLTISPMFSQTQALTSKPTFDVISVRPGASGTAVGPSGGSFRVSGATLRALLAYAYGQNTALLPSQIIGSNKFF
jgi:hypothetical protein